MQLSHLQRFKNGALIFNLSYERRLNWGSTRLAEDDAPRAKYSLWQSSLWWQYLHYVHQQAFMFTQDISAQYSQYYLYGVKQAELLGETGVRGFKQLSLSGEKQIAVKNQLSWLNQLNQTSIEPYLGFWNAKEFDG